jgi:hypothetical protein
VVIRRCLDDSSKLTFYLVFAPLSTPLATIVQAIGARWRIEEDLQACKDLGLDQYEVRSFPGWYRHVTLVLLAYAFLVGVCVQERLGCSPQDLPTAGSPMIPLTPSELRHLLARLLFFAPASVPLVGQWSHAPRAPISIGQAIPIVAAAKKPAKPPGEANWADQFSGSLSSVPWSSPGSFPWSSPPILSVLVFFLHVKGAIP